MSNAVTINKKNKNGFSQALTEDKHEIAARRSLGDFINFNNSIEKEMQRMTQERNSGAPFDSELFDKMALTQKTYKQVMTGFLELDEAGQRHALIVFADTIQDLMKYIHRRRDA